MAPSTSPIPPMAGSSTTAIRGRCSSTFAASGGAAPVRARRRHWRGCGRVGADPRAPVLLADDFGQPNGLCFSLDERHLFVNDTERKHIRRFDVTADGALADGRVGAETTGPGKGAPDGMKIDSAGNVYCCGPGGIHVFAPDAACLGVIRTPETAANFCFGDDDLRSLYVTASTSLYRVRVATPGTAQWHA